MAGENGGGAFVLVYLLCVLIIGLPLMMAEIAVGRSGRANPIHAFINVAKASNSNQLWGLAGAMGALAGVLILSFYSVIAGWSMDYVVYAARDGFAGLGQASISQIFADLVSNPEQLAVGHSVFMVLTIIIIAGGVKGGLERAVVWLMPMLFLLLLGLVGYSLTTGYFMQGAAFLLKPDWSVLSPGVVLAAMGQAFFSLSLGMGAIMMYGAYLPSGTRVPGVAVTVVAADTVVAIIAGLAIFPIVFAHGLEPAAGPGLVFETLPMAFGQIPGGNILGAVFFVLLVLAALTSAISLLEPSVAWLTIRTNTPRPLAALIVGGFVWVLGFGTVFSFNIWSEATVVGLTFFDVLDKLTSTIMLPLGGFLIATFVVLSMRRDLAKTEMALPAPLFALWYTLLRYVVRVAILLVFLHALGAIQWVVCETGTQDWWGMSCE